jgi:putative ABC transport system ATP-binding protein
MSNSPALGERAANISSPVIEASGLSKTFRRGPEIVHALRAIDLAIDRGEVVGLTGPSGSGKTTLLNVLCGWEAPDAGEICFSGTSVASPADLPWLDVAVVAQDLALMEELSVLENVTLPLRLSGAEPAASERATELLEAFGLDSLAPRLPEEASLGEQQRAAVARALVVRPATLLADEPFGHQDEGWTKVVMQTIREAAEEGTACLIATHDPETWPRLDRILALRDGAVVSP